ncbi:MAG: dihydrofolate reductase [Chloroflexi bacterium]|nr:dihydrofolate reductase [Chloroflexota bacterium]
MRKLVVLTFVTLDGVMQAPGGPEEDPSGGFTHGGWVVPYFDDFLGSVMDEQMGRPFDLLLGRRTFEIFATYWPQFDGGNNPINQATRYVASRTMTSHAWSGSVFLNGSVEQEVGALKAGDGPDLQVHGSADLIQTLLRHDLIDEFWLKIFPITLGTGKRLFAEGTIPAAFKMAESQTSPLGVIVAHFERVGRPTRGR